MNRIAFGAVQADGANFGAAPGYNQAYYRRFVQANPLFSSLIIRNLDLDPFVGDFNNDEVPRMARILSTIRMRIDNPEATDESCTALWILELMAPHIRTDKFVPQDRGRVILCRAMQSLF